MGRAHAFIVPLLRDLAVSLGCLLIRACQHLREGRWFLSLRAERFEKEERKGRKPQCFRMGNGAVGGETEAARGESVVRSSEQSCGPGGFAVPAAEGNVQSNPVPPARLPLTLLTGQKLLVSCL